MRDNSNDYGPPPPWKTSAASDRARNLYGMWSPQSLICRVGNDVVHARRNGREELVYRSNDSFEHYLHERGLLVVNDREILLARVRNGVREQRWLWRCGHDKFEHCSDGVVVQKGDKLFLATPWGRPQLLHQGSFDLWLAHPRGAIIRTGDTVSLVTKDGVQVTIEALDFDHGKTDAGHEVWVPHKDGILYKKGPRLILAKTSFFHELVHDFSPSEEKWVPLQKCGNPLNSLLSGVYDRKMHSDLRQSGCTWVGHPDGTVVQYESSIDLITSDRRVNLYRGLWDAWSVHPYGITVRRGETVTLHDGERPPSRLMDLPKNVNFGGIPFSAMNAAFLGTAQIVF